MDPVKGSLHDWSITTNPGDSNYKMKFELADNEVFINSCKIPEDKRPPFLTIPNLVDDKHVVGIDEYTFCNYEYEGEDKVAYDNTSIHHVSISEGIRYIGTHAFSNCVLLNEIELPSTLELTGYWCFEVCKKLKKIKLPDKLKVIEMGTFEGCSNLEMVGFPSHLETISYGAFSRCGLKTLVINEGVEEIKHGAFCGCEALMAVVLPRSLNKIGENVFDLIKKQTYSATEYSFNHNITLYCYPGSYALIYARENGFKVASAQI